MQICIVIVVFINLKHMLESVDYQQYHVAQNITPYSSHNVDFFVNISTSHAKKIHISVLVKGDHTKFITLDISFIINQYLFIVAT